MKDKLLISEKEFAARTQPALRLFLSVDLENSTQLKQRRDSTRETWLTAVLLFAKSFPQLFQAQLEKQAFAARRQPFPTLPALWKMLGDELLFVHPLQQGRDAHIYIDAFHASLDQWNKDVAAGEGSRGTLYVKGAAWLAGFPIANAVIHAGDGDRRADYVGPSIDAGFRIARLATRRRLALSVDLAWLLLKTKTHFRLHFDGSAILKGMAEESGYPSLWLEVGSSHYVQAERELLGYGMQADPAKTLLLCQHFITEFGVPRHIPFLQGDPDLSTKPSGFDNELQTHIDFLRREIYTVEDPAPAAAKTASKNKAGTKPKAAKTTTPRPTEEALLANILTPTLAAAATTAKAATDVLRGLNQSIPPRIRLKGEKAVKKKPAPVPVEKRSSGSTSARKKNTPR